MPRNLIVTMAFAAMIAAIAFSPTSSLAGGGQTFTVTRNDDPAPNGCKPDDCSLREAIIDANTSSAADTIIVPAMHINLSRGGAGENAAQTGDLDILHDLTLTGAGVLQTTVDGGGLDRVFDVPTANFPTPSDANVVIQGLLITKGSVAGVYNQGNLTLDHVTVNDNKSANDGGGVVSLTGLLTITDSEISDNKSDRTGGGIEASDVIIKNSTVIGNISGDGGGGVSAEGLLMTNTTVTGNHTVGSGGFGGAGVVVSTFLTNLPPSTILNSTITGNVSTGAGGGVLTYNDSPLTIKNSILWGNTGSPGPDCSGTITGDRNIIKSRSGCTISGTVIINDPMLFPLAHYLGPTESYGIPKDSPARDAADAAVCPDDDQNHIPRPQPLSCDIGAIEFMFLGDVDCSGAVAVPDLLAELGSVVAVSNPPCLYRGDLNCDGVRNGLDGLFILRHVAHLPEQPRPAYCPDIGPDTPLT